MSCIAESLFILERVTSLYICPWSLQDPLCQSQSLPYLRALAAEGYTFALITFENPDFAVAENQLEIVRESLIQQGIYWYPTVYHQGLSILAKAYDNFYGVILGLRVCYRHRPRIVHSRSSLTAAMAATLAKMLRLKFLYDADSMLSEEYVDINHWSRQSLGFKAMASAEKFARQTADQIIVLTDTLKNDLQNEYLVKTAIEVIPCCINTEKFYFDAKARERRRDELKIEEEKLFVYVGKIGSWYLVEEIFDFFREARQKIESCKLLIVTPDSSEKFAHIAQAANVSAESYFVVKATHDQVNDYLSASDVGLAFIKQLKSKRGSSPIKVAEYLSAGLPVVMTDGIGDCSTLIEENKVGAILKKTTKEDFLKALDDLSNLWCENKSRVLIRCRQTAKTHFSLEKVGIIRYRQVYQKLLNSS